MTEAMSEAVLHLFERHRAAPGTDFEESHFLDFLLARPNRRGVLFNSFFGLRRYNAFIKDVQLHFSICFSVNDFSANYSLDGFVQRITKLQKSRRSSLDSLRNQEQRGFGWRIVLYGDVFATILIVGSMKSLPFLAVGIFFLCAFANGFAIRSFVRWRSYQKRLMSQLQLQITVEHENSPWD